MEKTTTNYKIGDRYLSADGNSSGTIIYVLPEILFYVNEFRLIRLDGRVEYHSILASVPILIPHRESYYGDFQVRNPEDAPPEWWTGKYEINEPKKRYGEKVVQTYNPG
jgi:hypothetical protein